jgi:hypothetical protein
MLKDLYKVDKLKQRIDQSIRYFSPCGIIWLYVKGFFLIMLNNKPFNMAVDLHQLTNGDDKNGIECRILCLQRYSPIQLSIFWNFQIFVSMLPMLFFMAYSKGHVVSCNTKTKLRIINSEIVEVHEDGWIRFVKILTLAAEVLIEFVSIYCLIVLQKQKYGIDTLFSSELSWAKILFVIPETYECDTSDVAKHTYFPHLNFTNTQWETLNLKPCNNMMNKLTVFTNRSVESTLIHATLVVFAFITIFATLSELVYNMCCSGTPAVLVDVIFNRNMLKDQKITRRLVENGIRDSNFNLRRSEGSLTP